MFLYTHHTPSRTRAHHCCRMDQAPSVHLLPVPLSLHSLNCPWNLSTRQSPQDHLCNHHHIGLEPNLSKRYHRLRHKETTRDSEKFQDLLFLKDIRLQIELGQDCQTLHHWRCNLQTMRSKVLYLNSHMSREDLAILIWSDHLNPNSTWIRGLDIRWLQGKHPYAIQELLSQLGFLCFVLDHPR